jgi:hypothetical protein
MDMLPPGPKDEKTMNIPSGDQAPPMQQSQRQEASEVSFIPEARPRQIYQGRQEIFDPPGFISHPISSRDRPYPVFPGPSFQGSRPPVRNEQISRELEGEQNQSQEDFMVEAEGGNLSFVLTNITRLLFS